MAEVGSEQPPLFHDGQKISSAVRPLLVAAGGVDLAFPRAGLYGKRLLSTEQKLSLRRWREITTCLKSSLGVGSDSECW